MLIELVSNDFNINIPEFAVAGIPFQSMFAHEWWIGTDNSVDPKLLKEKLDSCLKMLNDDYRVERIAALKDLIINVLPANTFYAWMDSKGKTGSQNKFPRVLRNGTLDSWKEFVGKG